MAFDSAYATAVEYRAVFNMTDNARDADILMDLLAVSRYIEGKTGRFFNRNAADVTRVYIVPEYTSSLWVDDMSEAPSLIRLDTTGNGAFDTELATADYTLLPLNANLEPEPKPYMQLMLNHWRDIPRFLKGQRVEVTARFGWPAVPEAVKRATIHLASIVRLESPRATRRIPELGDAIEASSDAQNIIRQLLDRYKRGRYL
jgi:hypothetical protein